MAYCGPRGIPHSFFLGGPFEWTRADRDKAISWHRLDKTVCPSCSTRPAEWDPEQGGHPDAVTWAVNVCPGCERREAVIEQLRSKEFEHVRGKQVVGLRRQAPAPSSQ